MSGNYPCKSHFEWIRNVERQNSSVQFHEQKVLFPDVSMVPESLDIGDLVVLRRGEGSVDNMEREWGRDLVVWEGVAPSGNWVILCLFVNGDCVFLVPVLAISFSIEQKHL